MQNSRGGGKSSVSLNHHIYIVDRIPTVVHRMGLKILYYIIYQRYIIL